MNRATEHPQLAALPALVHEQRRKTAGQLRITREEKALRDQMRALLDEAGLREVECNGFVIRADVGRDGRATVRVTPTRNET